MWELHDLTKDPDERRSVCGDPAYADRVKELNAELKRLREGYRDDDVGGQAEYGSAAACRSASA